MNGSVLAHLGAPSAPCIVAALLILSAFGAVLVKSRFSAPATVLFVLGAIAAGWQVSLAFQLAADDIASHPWLTRTSMVLVCMVPTVAYHAAALLSYDLRDRRGSIVAAWVTSGFFATLTLVSPLMVSSTVRYSWGNYFEYGAAGIPFVLFCAVDGLAALVLVWRQWRRSPKWSRAARRSRLLVAGFGIGSVAMLDHLAAFGIGLFPAGGLWLGSGGVLIAIAALRYRLADITPSAAAEPLLEQVSDGVVMVDADRIVRLVNPAAADLLGLARPTLLHARVPATLDGVLPDPARLAPSGESGVQVAEIVHPTPDGHRRVLSVSARRPTAAEGETITVYTLRDVTAVRDAPLSEVVADRALVRERTEQMLAQAQQTRLCAAVAVIDPGAEPGGEPVGDIVRRLRAALRGRDMLLRHGSQLLLLPGPVRDRSAVSSTLDRLAGVAPGLAAGVAMYPQDSEDAQELLLRAWAALDALREGGRVGVRFHDRALHQRTLAQTGREATLQRVIAAGNPAWRYAPQIDVDRRAVGGVEILWWTGDARQSTELADSAMRSRDVDMLRTWTDAMLDGAIRSAARLRSAGFALPVTVPVSPTGLLASTLLASPAEFLRRHGQPASAVRIALTPMQGNDRFAGALAERTAGLVQAGIALDVDRVDDAPWAVDQFVRWGTRRVRIDLAASAEAGPPMTALAALRSLAQTLALDIAATGVESQLHAQAARALGISLLQGAFVAPLVDGTELIRTLPALTHLLGDPDHILPI
ncbi:MAG: EAL domain-containing protein [Burkholderiales bacterium]|nr:EAL domain-containing protein [Burkholderiales bacterium]